MLALTSADRVGPGFPAEGTRGPAVGTRAIAPATPSVRAVTSSPPLALPLAARSPASPMSPASPTFAAALWVALAVGAGCRSHPEPTMTAPFHDSFDGPALAGWWLDTGGSYALRDGALVAGHAYNHPIWLRKPLPPNVIVEVDVESRSAAGDIKLELAGDGTSFDPDRGGYVSTGYVLIFGGWHNSLSVICRNDEHDAGRKVWRTDRPVQPGRKYHFWIQRQGGRIDWRIDGAPFLAWTDPDPLTGGGHEYLAFNDWESEVHFDNLSIQPSAAPAQ
jgi:Farnesoic acid 0-methyl transferase